MDKIKSKLNVLSDDQLEKVVGGTASANYEEVNVVDWIIVSF